MTTRNKPDPLQGKSLREFFDVPPPPEGRLESRRRFVKAGLAATPVMMTVASRPVWGQTCSLSGDIMSGNVSQHTHDCSVGLGCTPGFWKQNLAHWDSAPWSPGTSYTVIDANGNEYKIIELASGTPFFDVFGIAPPGGNNDTTLSQVIANGASSYGTLAFHIVAAVLNAAVFPDLFGASVYEVISVYRRSQGLDGGGVDEASLSDVIVYMDNRGCPLSSHQSGQACTDDGISLCLDVDENGEPLKTHENVPVTTADGECIVSLSEGTLSQYELLTPKACTDL